MARARTWWLIHRDKAPWAFDDDLADLIAKLRERPDLIGRPVAQRSHVRRVYLRRIRYYAYFQIADGGSRVVMLALWHGNRGSDPNL